MFIVNVASPTGGFLINVMKWIMEITSSIAIGVVLFTILLKLITLPFDVMSRVSMRKNSLKMEEMRPELEKLQKQYAGDKALYNQKMMALYKKNGYSMMSACLPTIVTMVIFFIAIWGFNDYSKFENRRYFYEMSKAYNNVVYAGLQVDGEYIKTDADGIIIVDGEKILQAGEGQGDTYAIACEGFDISVEKGTRAYGETNSPYFEITTDESYVKYICYYSIGESGYAVSTVEYDVIPDMLAVSNLRNEKNNYLKDDAGEYYAGTTKEEAALFVIGISETMSARSFRGEKMSFLWVKNIWIADSPLEKVVSNDNKVINTDSCACSKSATPFINENDYNRLTAKLDTEKNTVNGFFILAVLTAGFSLLSQIVMNKSQKAQMELQSVDGQGATTQKMMTWMMPIMMAIFSFFFTAAFSIYSIISSVLMIGTTFAINYFIDKKYKKAKEAAGDGKIRGRVYVPETPTEEEKKQIAKEEKERKKNPEPTEGDFMTGALRKKGKKKIREGNTDTKDVKTLEQTHIRGRLK